MFVRKHGDIFTFWCSNSYYCFFFFFWQPPPGNSWLGSLIATIIGNLKISISNVHIRYEDSVRLVDTFFSECFCLLLKREIFIYLFVYFYYPDLFMNGIKY